MQLRRIGAYTLFRDTTLESDAACVIEATVSGAQTPLVRFGTHPTDCGFVALQSLQTVSKSMSPARAIASLLDPSSMFNVLDLGLAAVTLAVYPVRLKS